MRKVQESSVVKSGVVRDIMREDTGIPGVEVRVEVYYGETSKMTVGGAKSG